MKLNILIPMVIFCLLTGCASEHRLAKPKGQWISVNDPLTIKKGE